ncbi:4-amino-4-deoxy-L-arabinose transferase and related glycosyltransferases of PMT family [Marinactinospora thermotolerans DSM 45154]|uniref:4-amino-4-deoxy-L-arabinose transferase and related glycosyltransferases of PMT family n=1 Tax=Marinactinospora thermotolerans DSM 45154 TaxID=1122192 RepID=A0A1T4R0Z4_9ACTN|nr:glycosyltransferase [Marinactinospora thermotolerans]SKA09391.1 4-amino-4-deoxy-L-arabinose transferase and related glycosyltransferases of PMT family [Marinactinospora thermotolerans DSM 45154]
MRGPASPTGSSWSTTAAATRRDAEEPATCFPGRVEVVRHEEDRGYGAAVRSGVRAALDRTRASWVLLTDSDGQYRADALLGFLRTAARERADAVIGYRARRADPLHRRVNGALWTGLNRLLLRTRARDVDCAYKLVRRSVLERVDLRGEAAAVSPELVAKLRAVGARIVQRPVEHHPRTHGEQTGADLGVIWRSLVGMVAIWGELARAGVAGRLVRPRDPALAALTTGALLLSVLAYVHFLPLTLAYPDAISHLLIARRVVDSPTPGLAQLGGVWLPLPHLLALPFVWLDSWYLSGFAASLISMASYVVATRYLYKTAALLTGDRGAALIAGLVFAGCPGVLYLQSTPMTELLMIACVAAATHHLTVWCRTGGHRNLTATAVATLLATLTRYETWVFALAVAVIVAHVEWRRSPVGQRLRRTEANVIFFGLVGCAGAVGWVLWNAVIFGDPLFFQNGDYAKPSLWVSDQEATVGDWATSTMTYLYAIMGVAGGILPFLAVAGLVVHLVRRRGVAPLALLVFPPFFVLALYSGQRPLHVEEITGDLYNVRFALVMLLPIALFTGCLAAEVLRTRVAVTRRVVGALVGGAAAAMSLMGAVGDGDVVVLREAQQFSSAPAEQAAARTAAWLRDNYDGGRVLMESFGNETVMFHSRLPVHQIVYEGSYRRWEPALADPRANDIRWVHMRRTPGAPDRVWSALDETSRLRDYSLVYEDADRVVYRLREA